MIGGCRNAGDEQRVADLKSYTSELGLTVSTGPGRWTKTAIIGGLIP
jgi:hypothetical protein